jgi:predicted PurR-regulated permease PerM
MLVLSMAFTYLLRPGVNFLQRTSLFAPGSKMGRGGATLLMFVVVGVLIYLLVVIGLKPVTRDVMAMQQYFVALDEGERQQLIDTWQARLDKTIGPYLAFLGTEKQFKIDETIPKAITSLEPKLREWGGRLFEHASFIVELLLIPVLVFYFLSDGPGIRREAGLLLPATWRTRVRRMADDLDRVLDGYVRGQMMMCVIAWVFVSALLFILGVPHAFTLGLLAGLTRAIPVIGPLLGGVPLLLVCLATSGLQTAVVVLVGFTVMHFLESKVLLPKIIGHEVNLHPVSVIVTLLLGLEFFGFLGVFLAVPVAALGKILLEEWQEAQRRRDAAEMDSPSVDGIVADTT